MVTEELRQVEELRALRRVATLAAEGVEPEELFVVVAEEVARVVGVPTATVLRYEFDGTVSTCARSEAGPEFALGSRFALDGPSVLGRIRATGKPARIDDYAALPGELPDAVRVGGVRSAVGAPIVVSGRLWGAVVASSPEAEPLPEGTEARLADFTPLVASAISNAESRAALERIADEQAALRRVATLVAQGVPPAGIFAAVSEEVDALFGCGAGVARFEDDPPATVFAGVSKRITAPIGTRFEFQDGMASVEVYRTHRSARVDRNDWTKDDGLLATTARQVGLVSSVASPIVVDGRLWGTMNLWSTDELLPRDTAVRLEKFTELIATAISNAEAHEAVRLLADEQAALRRVATLVAKGVAADDLFSAVSDEVGRLFGSDTAAVVRFAHEPPSIVVVGIGKGMVGIPLGTTLALDEGLASTKVYRTGRPARVDERDWVALNEIVRHAVRRMGHVCAVASPITVGDALWGTITLSATEQLPPGTEARLERFGELVGIAIASAEAQEGLRLLADEQAALRRVATLVAQDVPANDLFSAVSDEVGRLFGSDTAAVVRFEHDPAAIVAVGIGSGMPGIPLGTRSPLDRGLAAAEVYRTGQSARIDARDWDAVPEPLRGHGRHWGLVSVVSSPITVGDRLWGAITLAGTQPLPPGTEARLERFGELVGIAIASADAQQALRLLADEQAALRRVATLVAQGVPAAEIFSAVSQEVARLFGDDLAGVGRFEPDGSAITLVGFSRHLEGAEIGTRSDVNDGTPAGRVLATGRSARFDANAVTMPEFARRFDIVSSVSSPIMVEGKLWGVMSALSTTQPLPADTERRLGRFSELIATAIANAEAQESIRLLADEQAALRRVATLVANGVPAAEIFSAVSKEVARLFGEESATVAKFDAGGAAVTLVGLAPPVEGFEIGSHIDLNEESPAWGMYTTGRSARADRVDGHSRGSAFAKQLAIVSSVSSPIIVEGTVWGVMSAFSTTKPLPQGAEERLERFSELLATAIANADSRESIRLLADEQAALRRVATLVARGVPAADIFSAVTEEVARLFGEDLAAVGRFDVDAAVITIVGLARPVEGIEIGMRVDISDETPAGRVYATGRPARVDQADRSGWSAATSGMGQIAGRLAIVSAVSSPIKVEGKLWGAISALSTTKPLPPDTERRLERFSELVATAIANTESRSELAASRRRIVTASDDARRRIERNLHDGTQQRLVSLALDVRAVEADVPPDLAAVRSELSQVATGLTDAVTELQEIARGIHPATLAQNGLGAALRTLARRSPIPVELDITVDGRLPEHVEVGAYYVASEALANAAKYSQATRIDLSIARRADGLHLAIGDDGVGGADPVRGSGLVGLSDRVEALGGSLEVASPSGQGTRISAMLPLGPDARAFPH